MEKAFIFDLDGVLINDESMWEKAKKEIYTSLFGEAIFSKLGKTVGLSMDAIYEKASSYGAEVSRKEYENAFNTYASKIYALAPLTPNSDELAKLLIDKNFVIAIVSASPGEWMDIVIQRLTFKNSISVKISIHDSLHLQDKPSPDGYREAMKKLGVVSNATIILEDSNAGIASARAAGAYTIGLKENLVEGYVQENADIYANNMEDVMQIVKDFSNRLHQ